MQLTAVKVPHHGSKNNLSTDLVRKIACDTWLVSTNGSQFNHPDREAIARIVKYGGDHKDLVFNYKTEFNGVWDDDELRQTYGYTTTYPDAADVGVSVTWDVE